MLELIPLLARAALTHQTQLGVTCWTDDAWKNAHDGLWLYASEAGSRLHWNSWQALQGMWRLIEAKSRCKGIIWWHPNGWSNVHCVCTQDLKILCIFLTGCARLLLWFWSNEHIRVFRFVYQCCRQAAKPEHTNADLLVAFGLQVKRDGSMFWKFGICSALRHSFCAPPCNHLIPCHTETRTETENRMLNRE